MPDSGLAAPLLQGFVVSELARLTGWSEPAALFHSRTAGRRWMPCSRRGVGVEVKASASVTSGDFGGLRALQEDAGFRIYQGVVLYTGDQAVPFGKGLMALPVGAL